MIKDGQIERIPCQSRTQLACAYYNTHADFEESLWDEADQTFPGRPNFKPLIALRREVRLACMMGGPL